MTEGLIGTYLSTLQALWPNSPEPRLHRSRGSGRSSSPGSLGFYVMPGGTLEITDARVRGGP